MTGEMEMCGITDRIQHTFSRHLFALNGDVRALVHQPFDLCDLGLRAAESGIRHQEEPRFAGVTVRITLPNGERPKAWSVADHEIVHKVSAVEAGGVQRKQSD